MDESDPYYRALFVLLRARDAVTRAKLAEATRLSEDTVGHYLDEWVEDDRVTDGNGGYKWRDKWERDSERREDQVYNLHLESEEVLAFLDHVYYEYRPPPCSRHLVLAQCAVRRPFSKSPSHASLKRAVLAATGVDPRRDWERCPVHVVVLASTMGPVPYEYEDVYPASLRAGGVKRMDPDEYEVALPILARRMARYVTAHAARYDGIAAFAEGRYGEVLRAAQEIADVSFPILPRLGGAEVLHVGDSVPRTYWQRYWIQLALEIVRRLDERRRDEAVRRLEEMGVEYQPGRW